MQRLQWNIFTVDIKSTMVNGPCGSLVLVENHSSIEQLECSSVLGVAETFFDVSLINIFNLCIISIPHIYISTPNISHIRFENFQSQSVSPSAWWPLNRTRSWNRPWCDAEAAALESGSIFFSRGEKKNKEASADDGFSFFFFPVVGQRVFASLSTGSDKGLIKHCAALELAVGR